MTQEELTVRLLAPFSRDYVERMASLVRREAAFGTLYALATASLAEVPSVRRHKLLFRGAYVLERVYSDDPAAFAPFAGAFCRTGFPACADPSARRHFTKIMAHLLQRYTPAPECLDRIAQCAAEWMVDPAAKIAVRANALDVLGACRDRVPWVADAWDDLQECLAHDATPGIRTRLRRHCK